MKHQYQIVQIQNGWLVIYVDEGEMKTAMIQGQQIQPRQVYCKDFAEVCTVLKREWPHSQD